MKNLTLDPARRIGFTSDTHYGHGNIIQYCLRPWLTEGELAEIKANTRTRVSADTIRRHDDALVSRINATLGADDILINAGDVAWGDRANLQEFRDRVNVREVYCVVGNHDSEEDLKAVYGDDRVNERIALTIGGQFVVVDHYPGHAWHQSHNASWQLFGHVHGALNAARRTNPAYSLSIDIGVDSHNFTPWLWPELVSLFAERKPQYDLWRARQYDDNKGPGCMTVVGRP
jgi:calcineurin-like phosphoesterase family protein